MVFQGWSNAKTWCVALTIDNTREHLETVLGLKTIEELEAYCHSIRGDIFHMATWAWPEAYQKDQVNWSELQEHYEIKRVEVSDANTR